MMLTRLKQIKDNDPGLTQLYLSSQYLSKEDCIQLVEAFKTNDTITSLYLGFNELGTEHLKVLVPLFETNTTITSLDLSWNDLKLEHLQVLAPIFKSNKTLETVNLNNNRLDAEAIFLLAEALDGNKTLKKLDIGNNPIFMRSSDLLEPISELMRKDTAIESLDVWNGYLNGRIKFIAKALETNTTLTRLNIGCSDYKDEDLQALAKALQINTTLKDLNLYTISPIDQKQATLFLTEIESNPALTSLNLNIQLQMRECLDTQNIKDLRKVLTSMSNLKAELESKKQETQRNTLPKVSESTATLFAKSTKTPVQKTEVLKMNCGM